MPGCIHLHRHNFEFNFSKSYLDPLQDRPGYFKEFNEEYDFIKCEFDKEKGPSVAKFKNNKQTYDVCGFGSKGTPINLQSTLPIRKDFKDKDF